MLGVDTNILVRLFTKDDPEQYRKVYSLFERENIWIADTVVLETEMVLKYSYQFDKQTILVALRKLFSLPNVFLENPKVLDDALSWAAQGLDFPDALHLAKSQTTPQLLTFDQNFAKRSRHKGECIVKLLD